MMPVSLVKKLYKGECHKYEYRKDIYWWLVPKNHVTII